MKFDPKSDGLNCAPAGDYSASIDKIELGTSKSSQQPMYTVALTVYAGETQIVLKDYIPMPDAAPKKFLWKFKRMCQATGKESAWESGDLATVIEQLVGQNVKVTLGVKTHADYGDSNTIDGYSRPDRVGVTDRVVKGPSGKPAGATITEEDIPF